MSQERSSSFYPAFLVLPKPKRQALSAVYAYCRLIDDIVDSGNLREDEARSMLAFWRAEIDRLYAGTPTHSVAAALSRPVQMFRLPKEAFLEIIRGCEMDLNRVRYETFADLESYLQGVAGAVGLLSVEIFGYAATPPERVREFARLFGYAFQMTNIIRDVGQDLENGRIYLPAADLKETGYTREALLHREHSPAFLKLMNLEYRRAKGFYQQARNRLDFRDRKAMLPAEIMAHVYEGLLDRMKETGFRVLFVPGTQSGWAKLRHAFKAWRYCHGF